MNQAADTHASHDHAEHDPNVSRAKLAHHFESLDQQFSSAKLGMWTFLATEILMFGGLFVLYSVFRANHPGTYLWAHAALDPLWGGINTAILLASSFTMAWAVRCAQLNQQKLMCILLALTFMGGVGFMGIKAIEYNAKIKHKMWVGKYNAFNPQHSSVAGSDAAALEHKTEAATYINKHKLEHAGVAVEHDGESHKDESHKSEGDAHKSEGDHKPEPAKVETKPAVATQALPGYMIKDPHGMSSDAEKLTIVPTATIPSGVDAQASEAVKTYDKLKPFDQKTVLQFFSIYYMMTGLHGIHVVVGMGLIAWLFFRGMAGHFHSQYFTPVDLGGLYWHLVDLIWIFLFPLLYLIH
jgi:cytochrome c oxidase subunit III